MSAIAAGSSADIAISIDDSSTESRVLERTSVGPRKRKSKTAAAVRPMGKRRHLTSIPPPKSEIPQFIGTPVATNTGSYTAGFEAVVRPEPQVVAPVRQGNATNGDELRLVHAIMDAQQQIHTNGPNGNDIHVPSERVRVSVSPNVKLDRAPSEDVPQPQSIGDNPSRKTVDAVKEASAASHEYQENTLIIIASLPSPNPTKFEAISCQAPVSSDSSGTEEKFPILNRVLRYLQLLIPVCLLVTFAVAFPVRSIHTAGIRDYSEYASSDPSLPTVFNWYGFGSPSHKPKISKMPTATVTGIPTERKKPLTLREVVKDRSTGFHLAMAPAFFGFYGYFGALAAWIEIDAHNDTDTSAAALLPLKSVAGASAGAMAAVLLAAGISPVDAAEFCGNITLDKFADFPGFGAIFRGNKFERLMSEFLSNCTLDKRRILTMEDAILPVAVTAFDLQTMSGKIVTTGSMARAARASATFPGLFQPVAWHDATDDCIFIDGGIADPFGMIGLTKTMLAGTQQEGIDGFPVRDRVVNLRVGSFRKVTPPGPSMLPGSPDVISIAIEGLPLPGPWAMTNGPLAFEAARIAMTLVMDTPLEQVVAGPGVKAVQGDGLHYLLVVNATGK